MSLQDSRIGDFTGFQTLGLKNVDQASFSQRNLIIGKNGSGKTRFLKALEQEKKQHRTKKEIVVTLYFSEIQAFYNSEQPDFSENSAEESSQEVYPYDLLLERDENSFYDFLKAMENDRAAFLENFLSMSSVKRTRKSIDVKEAMKDMNALLTEFLAKRIQIDLQKEQIFIEKIEEGQVVRALPLISALSEFSPGELMLFYLCVFLVIIKRNYPKGVVLIIDEPELHLHPRALVKMIQMLLGSENVIELWIASHSLFLVPLFAFEEIVFLENNTLYCRNSRLYRDLYDSLVGLDNINIFEFLKSLDNWQYYQFIAECFCLPEPVGKADAKDEQFCKLLASIRARLKDKPLRILDYGAGKCRIWECMQLLPDSESIKHQVSYTAYEPYPDDREYEQFKLYTDFADIFESHELFHAVVLMNVLHEIEGIEWERTFWNIKNVLADDGVLIFLEVVSLSKGEQPYGNNGYLVLQDKQVKILFDDLDVINVRVHPKEKSNCWILTKKQVENVTRETIKDSIICLEDESYNALETEFQKRMDYAHGNVSDQQKQMSARKYAFLSQQYINAMLTSLLLEDLWGEKSPSSKEDERNAEKDDRQPIKVRDIKPNITIPDFLQWK